MDEYDDATLEILTTAQVGCFWEMRAARLNGSAEGEMAAHQADTYARMLTTEVVLAPDPDQPARVLS